mmetsp:Transcript_4171/g.15737  ORF Transcript_4171/g.15737 Transcript_4171/m.15737 type:complete len:669 (-) Transcript_4171:224-2230(-)|eukprot:CAMPEP_0117438722 /NCGR_PEP_ID=MMETSP0759-20121206/2200_1 /TAXON_ID=63605 /ORGANISM="Percolomonas cosmopolitus, Strain WS" /LENGTH=668 /DNA_ID=CAMNT_0005230423 /DNA_START=108 /DNA_END=2114 /DNA_ORIENTATION=-
MPKRRRVSSIPSSKLSHHESRLTTHSFSIRGTHANPIERPKVARNRPVEAVSADLQQNLPNDDGKTSSNRFMHSPSPQPWNDARINEKEGLDQQMGSLNLLKQMRRGFGAHGSRTAKGSYSTSARKQSRPSWPKVNTRVHSRSARGSGREIMVNSRDDARRNSFAMEDLHTTNRRINSASSHKRRHSETRTHSAPWMAQLDVSFCTRPSDQSMPLRDRVHDSLREKMVLEAIQGESIGVEKHMRTTQISTPLHGKIRPATATHKQYIKTVSSSPSFPAKENQDMDDIERQIRKVKRRAKKETLRGFKKMRGKSQSKRHRRSPKNSVSSATRVVQIPAMTPVLHSRHVDEEKDDSDMEEYIALEAVNRAASPYAYNPELLSDSPKISSSPLNLRRDDDFPPPNEATPMRSRQDSNSSSHVGSSHAPNPKLSSSLIEEMTQSPAMRSRLFDHPISTRVAQEWESTKERKLSIAPPEEEDSVVEAPKAQEIYHLLLRKSLSKRDSSHISPSPGLTNMMRPSQPRIDDPLENPDDSLGDSKNTSLRTYANISKEFTLEPREQHVQQQYRPPLTKRVPSSSQLLNKHFASLVQRNRPKSASTAKSALTEQNSNSQLITTNKLYKDTQSFSIMQLCQNLDSRIKFPTQAEMRVKTRTGGADIPTDWQGVYSAAQ